MKTKLSFNFIVVLSLLWAALPAPLAQAATAETATAAEMLQFTAGGHILGFAAEGMYAATGSHALHVDFAGANSVLPQANSPASTDGKAASLSKVSYADLWDGINLTYTAEEDGIYTTTYRLAPGADPADIRLRYNTPLNLNSDGTLGIAFETGAMNESAPIAWQEINNQRVPVEAYFRVSGQEVSFALGAYDPGYALTIDPSLVWNTFLGTNGRDAAFGVAVDGSGNVYVTGYSTYTWGSPVRPFGGGGRDAFAAKLDPSGALTWNTFLGGSGLEEGDAIAVDGSGNVYVSGFSTANWGCSPVACTVRAYTAGYDAFAAKLDPSGALTWNTFLGGNGLDYGYYGIAVDGSGNVYVSGFSNAAWGCSPVACTVQPYTAGYDAFAAKLDPSGALTWNTFLGGSGSDQGVGIAVDGSGNVYVTGFSDADWGCSPVACTVRAYTGGLDAYAAKLDPSGALSWNTFLGGIGTDYGMGIAVDGSGNVYLNGSSTTAWGCTPTDCTVRAYTGGADAFAAKLDPSGALTWNTFLGGSGGDDHSYSVAVDGSGNLYIAGYSNASWGCSPVACTLRAYAGDVDAFAAKLDPSGALTWNTFLGGSGWDYTNSIALDGSGNVYVAGPSGADWGCSPVACTNGTFVGIDLDAFVAKVDLAPPTVVSSLRASTNPTNAASVDFTVTFSEAVTGVDAGDFALNSSGVTGPAVTGVSGSGTTYTVTVNTGSDDGTIRLDVTDDDTILDAAGNSLGGTGLGNGDYTGGEAYNIDKTAPTVLSSVLINPDPSNAVSVDFTVTFSEAVTGVEPGDFVLNTSGVTGASINTVSGSGDAYTVSVDTGTGDGTIRLDVSDLASITDLAENPLGGLPYTGGEAYNIDKTAPDTQIDSHPADPSNSADASFTFSSADGTAAFECSLDDSAFTTCTSPKEYTGLEEGLNTFAVRAKDPAGNVDDTPASYIWTVLPGPRHGGWLDEIHMSVVSADTAVTQLEAGALDVYASPLGSAQLPAIEAAGLRYAPVLGVYYDIMYNPAVCTDANLLNPFADRKIREATNRLYDRDYINAAIYAGGGLPKYFAIQTNGLDYADLADVARGLEAEYAFDEDQAIADIAVEMEALGATLSGGKWQYNGSPVTLTFLIRNDGDGTRLPMGDYVADQLEKAGFTIDRQYKKSSEAGPIWNGSIPTDCLWNAYTAGWTSTGISRDDKGQFQQMYLPNSLQGTQPFLSNVPDPVFQQVGDDLVNANFTTYEQRHDLMTQALSLSLQDSLQVFLIGTRSYAPYDTDVQITANLGSGLEVSPIAFHTVRFSGLEGGTMNWSEADLLTEPWNPVAGSNWVYDQSAIAATSGAAFMADPYTGLQWPLRAESAELTVQTGLPVYKTLDWVTLNTADTIDVPADAWVDWDATTQTFVPAGAGLTAKIKSVITYPADMFTTVTWHDGTPLSVADFVMNMIMTFDRTKTESAIYDESAVAYFESFMLSFKGVKIVSTSPLVIETYSDTFVSDAEWNITSWWPNYGLGEAPWEVIAVANLAEAAGAIAYSPDKANNLAIEWTSFVGGPSPAILDGYLDGAIAGSTIPYAATMSAYITVDDADARYAALKAWYTAQGHFWVGTGPYFLNSPDPAGKTLSLMNFEFYPDLAERWSGFAEPRIAEVSVTGPDPVAAGDTPTFDITVTFDGSPYPNADINSVNYLLYDANGDVAQTGPAVAVGEGLFQVTLSGATTAGLADGASRIEAVVVVKPVVIPTFAHFDFLMDNPPGPRHGGWLDEIDMSVVSSDMAVIQLEAGALDVYASPLGSAQLPAIEAAGLKYAPVLGVYYDILYNPAVCTDTNLLNPFTDRKIREATNRLYDRDYIKAAIYAGGGQSKLFAIQTNGLDYADLADVAYGLEAEYAFDEDQAIADIAVEMEALGATLSGGKWQYNGSPVTLTFLIRNDGDGTRLPMGDYVADQLETAGFTVDRQYKKASEASPIWIGSNPSDCQWNLYTAGWGSTGISRDDKEQFQQMYLPNSVQGMQVFQANVPDPVFQQVGDDLANANFTNLEQRHDLMTQALSLSLQDSLQVFLINSRSYAPFDTDVQVTANLATGLEWSPIAFHTARFTGLEGGTMNWGEVELFTDPWNPVAGSGWTWDQSAIAATSGAAFMADPYTGLQWPLRAESAELTVQTGLPIFKTLDWLTLNTADTIDVPADAWADWDATTQTFVPAGAGLTAKIKSVITYPADMFTTVTWHDGSPLSAADFVMSMIMTFDRAKTDSAIYDEQALGKYNAFMSSFKGVKIVSTSPLVIETYSDTFVSDAELNITSWWPNYGYGEAPWDVIAVANQAEAAGAIAYSPDKAYNLAIEWTSFVGGPSLAILDGYLDGAIAGSTIPYAATMSAYITVDDANARYASLKAWYTEGGHMWVGTGPYYLDAASPIWKTLVLKNYGLYPDLAERWSGFAEPRIAAVSVTGPDPVAAGDTPTFDITITFDGDPYPNADINSVNYLLYDANGEVVETGPATAVGEGLFQVTLSGATTATLADGDSRIEAAVVVKPVVIPTFAHFDFLMVNRVTISGNAGFDGVTLSFMDAGIPQAVISDVDGSYDIDLPYGWSGTVTPTKTGYSFSPANRVYADVATDQTDQDYIGFLPPANVQASDGTYTDKVRVSWTAASGATSYKVYRATSTSGTKVYRGFTAGTIFDDTTPSPGVTYTYWVTSCIGANCTDYSTSDTGWRKLTAPANVQATDGTYTDKVRVTWTASSGATSYKVYRATTATGIKLYLGLSTGSYFDDITPTPGITYYYWVVAYRSASYSDYSTYNTGWRKLLPPTNVQATDGTYTDKVRVTWTASLGATSYKIYRAENSSGTKVYRGIVSGTYFDDITATPGVTYYYWVVAYRSASFSGYSLYNTGWRKLSAPLNVQASDGTYTDKVRVSWTASLGATSYKVYRAATATGTKVYRGLATGTYFDDTTATPGVTYYYWVVAYRGTSYSAYSTYNTGWRR